MPTPLITALQKTKPIITKVGLKIEIDHLIIPLKKKEFIQSLLEEYTQLRQEEAKNNKKTALEFDTDYVCNLSLDCNVFVIQEVEMEDEKEQQFAFIVYHPHGVTETNQATHQLPSRLEKIITWDELKAWCEYVLVACGQLDALIALEEELQTKQSAPIAEEIELEEDEKLHERKTHAHVGDIFIYPSKNSTYRAVWVGNTKDNRFIEIAIEKLHELADFLQNSLLSQAIIHSVQPDLIDESIVLSWGKKNFKMTFIDDETTSTVKLSPKKAAKLSNQIDTILENQHLI